MGYEPTCQYVNAGCAGAGRAEHAPAADLVSPLLGQLRHSLHLSGLAASLLPAVPMVMMGAVALFSATLMQRVALKPLTAGRADAAAAGARARNRQRQRAGAQRAVCRHRRRRGADGDAGTDSTAFSRRSAAVTGLWAGALMGGGGLGAALSPWLSAQLGVPLALSGWALPVLLAILLWLRVRVPAAPDAQVTLPPLWRKPRAGRWR